MSNNYILCSTKHTRRANNGTKPSQINPIHQITKKSYSNNDNVNKNIIRGQVVLFRGIISLLESFNVSLET